MRPDRRRLLETHQRELAQNIDINNVLPYLQASAVIPDGVVESINSFTGLKARLELVKAIKVRGDEAYNALYEALLDSKQENLASLLRPLVSIENNENYDDEMCHSCPHTPRSISEIRLRSVSEHDERDNFFHFCHRTEHSGTFPRTRPAPDPSTAWIEADPMELAGVLNIPVEGTDGHSAKDQIEMWNKNSNNIYANFSSPKGFCLLINNHKFSNMPHRNGTEIDCKNISNLFRQLGYKIFLLNDLTAKEMMNAFCDFAQNKSHGSSLIVVVLTHGERDQALIGTDGEQLNINHVLSQFNSVNARHLTGKPKLFFFQACRGDRYDHGVVAHGQDFTDTGFDYADGFPRLPKPFSFGKSKKSDELRLPQEADFFVAYATTSDYVSWRNNISGTWFIQAICEVFSRHAREMEIGEMMTLVNNRIAHGKATNQTMYKQSPEYLSRLRKKFYFFPGIVHP